jgi:Domain of unknown function (DUF4386)
MSATNRIARQAGALYFLFMLMGICGEFLFPTFSVVGDPAATARNIVAGELTYRAGILLGLATHVVFLFLVVLLYRLFEQVDRGRAVLMVVLVSVGVAVALDNMLNRFAPLILLDDAKYLSEFTRSQLEALALASFRYRSSGSLLPTCFWGLWLFPFGLLVMKSRFLPRILGVLIVMAGVAYCVTSTGSLLWPEHRGAINRYMTPLYFGEVPIIFWLLIKGARERPLASTHP